MNSQQTTQSGERRTLDFERATIDAFSFLESDYGFRCVSRSPTFVRFESAVVFANVYHGRSSYELGVEVRQLSEDAKARFRLQTIIAALLNGDEQPKSVFQASNKDAVRNCLTEIGFLVKSYCGNLLRVDEDTYRRVQNVSEQIGRKTTEYHAHAPLREKAKAFWRQKKYGDALRLYEEIGDDLTPAEQRRVVFAKRKSQ